MSKMRVREVEDLRNVTAAVFIPKKSKLKHVNFFIRNMFIEGWGVKLLVFYHLEQQETSVNVST